MTKSIELKITGMHCAGCVGSVENALRKVEGVQEAVVNLTLEKGTISGSVESADLLSAIEKTGYGAELLESDTPINLQEKTDEKLEIPFHFLRFNRLLKTISPASGKRISGTSKSPSFVNFFLVSIFMASSFSL